MAGGVGFADHVQDARHFDVAVGIFQHADAAVQAVDARFQRIQAAVDRGDVLAQTGQFALKAVHQGFEGVEGGRIGRQAILNVRAKGVQVAGLGIAAQIGRRIHFAEQAGNGDRELVAGHRAAATVGAVRVADHNAGFLKGVHRAVRPVVGRHIRKRPGGRLCMADGRRAQEGQAHAG
jgi:hypothetical protein